MLGLGGSVYSVVGAVGDRLIVVEAVGEEDSPVPTAANCGFGEVW